MGFFRTGLTAGATAILMLAAQPAAAEMFTYRIPLAPANQVPPVNAGATGSADLTYDTVTRVVTWNITHSGLTAPATAAHFHGPATALQNAPVIVTFTPPLTSPFMGMATLTPDQATQFLAGSWYINIHTPANPGGELRGQVPKRP